MALEKSLSNEDVFQAFLHIMRKLLFNHYKFVKAKLFKTPVYFWKIYFCLLLTFSKLEFKLVKTFQDNERRTKYSQIPFTTFSKLQIEHLKKLQTLFQQFFKISFLNTVYK